MSALIGSVEDRLRQLTEHAGPLRASWADSSGSSSGSWSDDDQIHLISGTVIFALDTVPEGDSYRAFVANFTLALARALGAGVEPDHITVTGISTGSLVVAYTVRVYTAAAARAAAAAVAIIQDSPSRLAVQTPLGNVSAVAVTEPTVLPPGADGFQDSHVLLIDASEGAIELVHLAVGTGENHTGLGIGGWVGSSRPEQHAPDIYGPDNYRVRVADYGPPDGRDGHRTDRGTGNAVLRRSSILDGRVDLHGVANTSQHLTIQEWVANANAIFASIEDMANLSLAADGATLNTAGAHFQAIPNFVARYPEYPGIPGMPPAFSHARSAGAEGGGNTSIAGVLRAQSATSTYRGGSEAVGGKGKGCCFLVFVPTIREIRDFYREM
eukprot:SAG31_NODE_168_length_21484_cov_21.524994_10_plen_383_part_00